MKQAVVVSTFALVLSSGCHRGTSSQEQPAPSASVITIGVSLGACPDVPVCAKECDAGSADRCRRLAATYALGQGVEKDEARASALYEHACDMKDPPACVFAGQMHEYAHGVAKDDARAARFYERGCDLGWAPGCYNLAIMYERGTGVPQERAKAGELYQNACAAGAHEACEKARQMRELPPPR
jgi:TPR repeat protein